MMKALERFFLNVTTFAAYDVQDQRVDLGDILLHMLILYVTIIACLVSQSFRDYFFYVGNLYPTRSACSQSPVKERERNETVSMPFSSCDLWSREKGTDAATGYQPYRLTKQSHSSVCGCLIHIIIQLDSNIVSIKIMKIAVIEIKYQGRNGENVDIFLKKNLSVPIMTCGHIRGTSLVLSSYPPDEELG